MPILQVKETETQVGEMTRLRWDHWERNGLNSQPLPLGFPARCCAWVDGMFPTVHLVASLQYGNECCKDPFVPLASSLAPGTFENRKQEGSEMRILDP